MPKVKIFFNPEAGEYFDEDLPFVAFGEDCEKTLEYLKEGISLPILNVRFYRPDKEATEDVNKAAFFAEGKLQKVGDIKEIYELYGRFLLIRSEKKDMIELNAPIIERLKKLPLPFKIKSIKITDEGGKGNYVFDREEMKVEVEVENWEGKLLAATLWRKETFFTPSFKLLEMIGKVKEGKVSFTIDSTSIPEGEWLLKFFYKLDGQVQEIKEVIEIRIRRLLPVAKK